MSDEQIRLLLADDQELVRMGFRMVLDAQPDMQVVGEVGDGAAAVELAAQADVVLMDIRMPRMDGVEATRRIVASGVAAKVLVLTTFDLDEYVHTALKAGAGGFLNSGLGEMLERFQRNGHGATAQSWVAQGPNQAIAPQQLEQAIGPDVLATLAQRTGLTRDELLSRLSRDLPDAVDRYTPDGRVPAR